MSILTRSFNKRAEAKRIKELVTKINSDTLLGNQIKESFKTHFDKDIDKVVNIGGRLKDHYDFIIHCTDGSTFKCEEKSTCKYMEDLESIKNPWDKSVQRFNGPGNKLSIGVKYAKHWYTNVTSNQKISDEYNVSAEIPSLDDWVKCDAFKCGNPTSEWGKEFKRKYRLRHPNTSMNGKKTSPFDYREIVNSSFEFTSEDKQKLIEETQTILDSIMDEKDCWFQNAGLLDNKFNFRWHSKIRSPKIKNVEMTYSKGADIYFNFYTENADADFKCILRFGKGTGFSNIRFDIR